MGSDKIDFSKLLGFGLVTDELAEGLDFQNDTLGSRIGAKVGDKDLPELKSDPEADHD